MPAEKPRLTPEDRAFFARLGARICTLRKDRGMTQAELSKMLGCSQPLLVLFEKGRRRIPVSDLATLAGIMELSLDDLVGIQPKPTKRGPAPKLQRQFEQLSKLPKTKQRFVSEMLDGVLQKAG